MTLNKDWNEHLSEIINFWRLCKSEIIPQKYAKNLKLGQWVMNQRSQYKLFKSGGKYFIIDERISQLEKHRFKWNSEIQLTLGIARNLRLSDLLEFKQQ